jgi:actin-related protein
VKKEVPKNEICADLKMKFKMSGKTTPSSVLDSAYHNAKSVNRENKQFLKDNSSMNTRTDGEKRPKIYPDINNPGLTNWINLENLKEEISKN